MRALLVLVVGIGLLLVAAWLGQRRLIYFPAGEVPTPEQMGLAGVEQVTFRAKDGIELAGWWVRASAPRPTGLTAIVFNGNGGNRAYRAPLAGSLSRLGLSVLLFDYRGYGGNAGTPTEEGLAEDARAAVMFVRRRPGVDPRGLVYFGESLGAAVAVRLATEQAPAALILRSPFTSLTAIGQHHYPYLPVRWLLRDKYASLERIRSVRCPVLVIAGARDTIVPADQSRALFDAANEPKKLVVIPAADHNDFELLAGAQMLGDVFRFLKEHVRPQA